MTPQRRTALVSIGAAAALVALKLGTGLASGSLGLVSEALHSGTDLVAALLTFFAIGVAGRPADRAHQYGHGKAEHLAALAEASVLALVSLVVAALAVTRLTGRIESEVDPSWWVFLVVGVVLAIDLARTVVSLRTARRYGSEALRSNALHFGSDFAGTLAVLAGLIAATAGYPGGDSIAALFVAALVLVAAARLIRRNVDVLMDRAPADAEAAARDGDRGDRAAGPARAAAPAPGGGADVRRRRDLGARPAPRSARDTRRQTGSRRSSSAPCRGSTSSSTSSRDRATRRCASAPTLRRSRCRGCGRSTTSASSRSTGTPSSRST